jgi:hypothetical protein
LGHRTTIDFGVRIAVAGDAPLPLSELDIRYPSSIGLTVGGLGVGTCSSATLEAQGPQGCPADSRMGRGSAVAEVPLGPVLLEEDATVTVVRAPEQEGHIALLFYLTGMKPIVARITFLSVLFPGPTPSQESIHIHVPIVPGLPGAAEVALQSLHITLGPPGLTYYERVRGKEVAYRPPGIILPNRCPRGGFTFNSTFVFLGGARTDAHANVPCPARPRGSVEHPQSEGARSTER